MNLIGSITAWMTGLWNSPALQGVGTFLLGILHDELPLAENAVATVVASLPADLAASKPLVALGTVATQAGALLDSQGKTVGINAIAVASANAIAKMQQALPVTSIDQGAAVSAAQQKYETAVAAAKATYDAEQAALDAAAKAAQDKLVAKITN